MKTPFIAFALQGTNDGGFTFAVNALVIITKETKENFFGQCFFYKNISYEMKYKKQDVRSLTADEVKSFSDRIKTEMLWGRPFDRKDIQQMKIWKQ